MQFKHTAPRPTALFVDGLGTLVIAACSIILISAAGENDDLSDVFPIGAAWVGAMIARAMDVLKDSPDEIPTVRWNIIGYATIAGGFLVGLTVMFRNYPQAVVPALTGFGGLYGAIGSKIVNNENALAEGFEASSSSAGGCRYPKE